VRVPLILRNGINTRTAKPGDSVYFETFYPIAQNDRVVIPMGSFMRGHVVETKRPGRIKGRGEIRILVDSLTFANGYTPELRAKPDSADTDGGARVDSQGKIRGPSGVGQDVATIVATTLGGFYAGSYVGLLSAFSRGSALTGLGIGTGVGATAGLATVLLTRGPEAELPRGTMLDVVFDRPLILDADRLPANEPGRLSLGLQPVNSQSNEGQRNRTSRHGRFPF
jgi:type IV secretion system protein VirB10